MKNIKLTPPPGGVANADAPWELHFEADTKDAAGAPVKVVVDGFMENIGAYKRFITGTWQQGTRKAPSALSRTTDCRGHLSDRIENWECEHSVRSDRCCIPEFGVSSENLNRLLFLPTAKESSQAHP